MGNFDFGFWVKRKHKYIIHWDFVLARSWSYDKQMKHGCSWTVPSWWHVNLGTTYLNVPLATVHHLYNVALSQLNNPSLSKQSIVCTRKDLGIPLLCQIYGSCSSSSLEWKSVDSISTSVRCY